MLERHVIKYFAPGWFAVVMGTGGLANVLYQWQSTFPVAKVLGLGAATLTEILYLLVLVLWVIRWISFFEYARRDLHHPVASNFFVTMPVATVIVGTNIYNYWRPFIGESISFVITSSAWTIGLLGVTFFSFYTTFRIIQLEVAPKPEMTNFSWIMAPIANMATLLLGNTILIQSLNHKPSWSVSILILNSIMFGIGFFLFIFISAVIFVRLIQHSLPPAELTPSFGILLSAVGLATIAIIDMSKSAATLGVINSVGLANLGAIIIWGFGFWVIGITCLICIYHLRRGGIPFGLGWWAFIFPLAAYTIATQKISGLFVSPLTFWVSVVLTIVLLLLWGYVLLRTIVGIYKGNLFMGSPIFQEPEKTIIAKS
ncbi:C4-dicarboxylate ABC transporter [Desulfosporosinus sp. HMP52]|uniref:SLAC1 family transporter n=1 Tax=Desulfosporosinus sp. HMP52 TaxID=1487923 RepID=UPI00051FCF51|nr:C4-dicarboxylate ABC transporter [Desulfosporosinus sp. HMP52]KGK87141.1 C4-dicarboxylate ABC transporter [Desulfosporosinus sp. HMP52]